MSNKYRYCTLMPWIRYRVTTTHIFENSLGELANYCKRQLFAFFCFNWMKIPAILSTVLREKLGDPETLTLLKLARRRKQRH